MTRIYLDHAAHTPVLPEIIYGMAEYMKSTAGNPSSPHAEGRAAAEALEQARARVARLCGAESRNVIFTSGGTEADNLALTGVCNALSKDRNRILMSAIEHDAMLSQIPNLNKWGFEVELIPPDPDGVIRPETVAARTDGRTALVCVMLANHETGAVQPVPEIAEIAHRSGALLVCDCVAGAPYLDLKTEACGADVLTLSGHKIGGPDGIGAVVLKQDIAVASLWSGGGQERGRRPGSEPATGAVGMGIAAERLAKTVAERASRADRLKNVLYTELRNLEGVTFHAAHTRTLPSHQSLSVAGIEGKVLVALADRRGVALSTGSACRSRGDEPSPVLSAMGLSAELCRTAVRISLSYTQTEEEMRDAAARIRDAVRSFRGR